MNVLIISAHAISLDRRIISQANALCNNGYEVTLVSIPIPDDCSRLIDSKIIKCIPFTDPTEDRSNNFHFKSIIKKLLPNSILEFIQFQRNKTFCYSLKDYFLKQTPNRSYDFIHAHDLTTLESAIAIRDQYSAKAKIIYDAHELYPHQFASKIVQNYWQALESKLLKSVDALIAINPSCQQHFNKTYINCPPSHVLYNSYGLNYTTQNNNLKAELCAKIGWQKDLPIGLFHGGLSLQRNLSDLVKAFKKFQGVCNLLIVGCGPAENNLQNICKSHQLNNVHLLNWVEQDKLPEILNSVDFGIIPYLYNRQLNHLYCTPNKLFEFMHFKLPILSSDLLEITRIINKYGLGKTYPLENIDNFHSAITDFLVYKNTIGNNNFDTALQEYGWEQQEKVLLEIYQDLK